MTKVLVPLDGSEFAEQALTFAEALAGHGASLVLVQVALAQAAGRTSMKTERLRSVREADRYLKRLERYLTGKGLPAERLVRYGGAAEELIEVAQEVDADLIVMATHGRSGISRWALGSVTDRLVRTAPCPVLVVRAVAPPLWTGAIPDLSRVVVPLDGSELAEAALDALEPWYGKLVREVVLVQVVSPTAEHLEEAISPEHEARTYLATVAAPLESRGVRVQTEVQSGDPSEGIAATAAEYRADLIVLSSHGRSGLARWFIGSVAQQVVERAPQPVLLVRQGVAPEHPTLTTAAAHTTGQCFNCGRRYYGDPAAVSADARCLRCGFHLHTCGNCVYFDTIRCVQDRPEANSTIPGQDCPQFTFRWKDAAAPTPSQP